MKPIGGYFEIEEEGLGIYPHKNGLQLNTGRNALEHILRSISNIECIYIPYYTCEVVLEPIKKLHIPYNFYHINELLEIEDKIVLGKNEYIIVNNYFGIKDYYIEKIASIYKENLIIDCAQAFFQPILQEAKMFYSTRKFVGVPDGGVAYNFQDSKFEDYETDDSSDRLKHLYIRKEYGPEAGFNIYKDNEKKLDNIGIRKMSNFTRNLLQKIDYASIIEKRRKNYEYLHSKLKEINKLLLPDSSSFVCPMVYPYYTNDNNLKAKLIENKIFVATYWPNVLRWCNTEDIEYKLVNNIITIPIDHRYTIEDMDRVIKLISIL
ncbi:MAG: hypothetical protein J6V18_07750 [Bacteroidales bacterium]|nr:hypothetical protein [Bacteroidales bacterium]